LNKERESNGLWNLYLQIVVSKYQLGDVMALNLATSGLLILRLLTKKFLNWSGGDIIWIVFDYEACCSVARVGF
jgi:hypothetical protein